LFEADEARASVEVRAPLVIAVETVAADTYALRLELGPARVTREGAEGAIDWGGGELAEAGADARLIARARLTRPGRIRAARAGRRAGAGAAGWCALADRALAPRGRLDHD